jgi:hypothetical protein
MTSYIEYKRLMHAVGGEIDRNVVRVRETRWKGSAPLLGVGVTRGLGLGFRNVQLVSEEAWRSGGPATVFLWNSGLPKCGENHY